MNNESESIEKENESDDDDIEEQGLTLEEDAGWVSNGHNTMLQRAQDNGASE